MGFFSIFRKKEKTPKELEGVYEKMRVELEGRKLTDQAISYRNVGEYQKAYDLLREAVEKYGYKPAITIIGTTAMLKGDVDGAIEWFEVNIKNPPEKDSYLLIEWYANLGNLYFYKKENIGRARLMFESAINISKPKEISDEYYQALISPVHRDIAVVYLASGEFTLAYDYAMLRLSVDQNCETSKKVLSMLAAELSRRNFVPRFQSQPTCGTVIFTPDGKKNLIGSGGATFASGGHRFLHAMGHVLLHDIYETAEQALPQYQTKIKIDLLKIEAWAGVVNSVWSSIQEERFVHQYEIFMSRSKSELNVSISEREPLNPVMSEIISRHSGL